MHVFKRKGARDFAESAKFNYPDSIKWEDNIKYDLCEPLPVAGQVVSPLRASPGNGTSCVGTGEVH